MISSKKLRYITIVISFFTFGVFLFSVFGDRDAPKEISGLHAKTEIDYPKPELKVIPVGQEQKRVTNGEEEVVEAASFQESIADPELQDVEAKKASDLLVELQNKISLDEREYRGIFAGANPAYEAFRAELLALLEKHPDQVDQVIDQFLLDPNSSMGLELSEVLSEAGLPEIQEKVLEFGLDASADTDSRKAALLTMAGIEKITGETRDTLLASFDQEQDKDLLQYQIMALNSAPSTAEDVQRVQSSLKDLIATHDYEGQDIRRHASYQIGEWATNSKDLEPLRELAFSDDDINVRARAIMSIGTSTYRSEENKTALFDFANNPNEPAAVRLKAVEGLSNYTLTEAELSDYHLLSERVVQEHKDSLYGSADFE